MGGAEPLVEPFEHKKRCGRVHRARYFAAAIVLRFVHVGLLFERFDDFPKVYFTFGFKSSCERALFMFSLVMRFTPVSTVAGTFSPLDAASAVLTPKYPMLYGSWTTSATMLPSV